MYLRTDEEVDAAEAMSVAARFAEEVELDLHKWRWLIIALHGAAQGVMVMSLRHGNGLLSLTDKSAAAWMKAYEADTKLPPVKLDNYLNLYAKVKDIELGCLGGNQRFIPFETEDEDIERLNFIRNDFIHFTPKGWSLQIDGLPRIALATARLIGFIAADTQNIFWHSQDARERLVESHARFTTAMRRLEAKYAALSA